MISVPLCSQVESAARRAAYTPLGPAKQVCCNFLLGALVSIAVCACLGLFADAHF